MSNLDQPTYTLSEVSAAAGAKPNTLHNWFHRGLLTLGPQDKPAAAAGATTLLTGRTALALGLAMVLSRQGVDVPTAITAGKLFANTGDEDRQPACLFAGADVLDTLLVISQPEGAERKDCNLVARTHGMPVEGLINSGSYGVTSCAWLTVIPLANTINSIRHKLGLPEDRG